MQKDVSFCGSRSGFFDEIDHKLADVRLHLQDLLQKLLYVFSQDCRILIHYVLHAVLCLKPIFASRLHDVGLVGKITLLDGELLI